MKPMNAGRNYPGIRTGVFRAATFLTGMNCWNHETVLSPGIRQPFLSGLTWRIMQKISGRSVTGWIRFRIFMPISPHVSENWGGSHIRRDGFFFATVIESFSDRMGPGRRREFRCTGGSWKRLMNISLIQKRNFRHRDFGIFMVSGYRIQYFAGFTMKTQCRLYRDSERNLERQLLRIRKSHVWELV